ncbi:replication restart DNA helicase PriA [Ectothiorhodospira magna]|uniref:Replication restart protein PriA n=1 Tax=Ectothiorhodospira magna TaxID=867345 RepID=A0A1H9C4C1_9GAMM|nr:primosomal protein N' [Ectothiorhodospira magna]SEP95548.1 replication restart DNA helicase PriA [Ectothiorhodospira magna]
MPQSSATPILQIAVPTPVQGYFDYLPAPDEANLPAIGARVRVPFGRRQMVGVVIGHSEASHVPSHRLRPIVATLDAEPLLDALLLNLLTWAADYYQHPLGEVMAAALPVALRQGKPAQVQGIEYCTLTEAGRRTDPASLPRAPRQTALLRLLQDRQEALTLEQLRTQQDTDPRQSLKALVDKGLVQIDARSCLTQVDTPPAPAPALNAAQQQAVEAIVASLDGFTGHLLEGVTGSGKTEVYLQVIRQVLASGRQCLVLVPEIALTPQLLDRFRARLDIPIAVLHSGLNDSERLCAWLCARSGEAGVVIGTRSAVFAPWARPGLIIVDEEHDPSLKQQDGFRYHARDLAVMRAHREQVPVVLGSATPALESLANVARGQYRHLSLPGRAGGASAPRLKLLDVRSQFMDEGLSVPLLDRIQQHLEDDGQVLLFLNRRGYAPALICHECGWVADCHRCDARMTWHAGIRRLRCHHCGHETGVPAQCPSCSRPLVGRGQGTERVEQALRRHFPAWPVVRIDRDSTRRKGALASALEGVRSGQHRILVGTQMLAKGHDFPNVTLAAILEADQGLFSADFRAVERLAQTIVQVAGRAGRGARPGEVLIQTHHPDHPLLLTLLRAGYGAFAQAALAERREAHLPPYAALALLRAEAADAEAPRVFLEGASQALTSKNPQGVQAWGPAPAPMERKAGRYRAHLLLQADQRRDLRKALAIWLPDLPRLPGARKVRWSVDVDPVDLQ